MSKEFGRLKVEESTHHEVKILAAKAGVSIIEFVKILVKTYKGVKK